MLTNEDTPQEAIAQIPLSWLRQEWKRAHANWAYNNGGGAYDMWRDAIEREISRRTIAAANERIAKLEAIIRYIDAYAPLSDESCVVPGLSLSEAAESAIRESENDAN